MRDLVTPGRPSGGHWVTQYQTDLGETVIIQIFGTPSRVTMTIACPRDQRQLDDGAFLSITVAGPPEVLPLALR